MIKELKEWKQQSSSSPRHHCAKDKADGKREVELNLSYERTSSGNFIVDININLKYLVIFVDTKFNASININNNSDTFIGINNNINRTGGTIEIGMWTFLLTAISQAVSFTTGNGSYFQAYLAS